MARLTCWIQPRASRTEVVGRHGNAIRIRVAAPPVDGAANEELVRFLAQRLGIARDRVTIAAGAGSRRKTVDVAGLAPTEVEKLLLPEP
jgi:uncharacterized protein (TIGR00251 family)